MSFPVYLGSQTIAMLLILFEVFSSIFRADWISENRDTLYLAKNFNSRWNSFIYFYFFLFNRGSFKWRGMKNYIFQMIVAVVVARVRVVLSHR